LPGRRPTGDPHPGFTEGWRMAHREGDRGSSRHEREVRSANLPGVQGAVGTSIPSRQRVVVGDRVKSLLARLIGVESCRKTLEKS
jgi:hypothetical protein